MEMSTDMGTPRTSYGDVYGYGYSTDGRSGLWIRCWMIHEAFMQTRGKNNTTDNEVKWSIGATGHTVSF